MNDAILNRQRVRGAERPTSPGQYTAKDFQLEVLDRLEEVQGLAAGLEESWDKKLEVVKEQRLLKIDSRTLVAFGAIALSIAGYVIQGARSTARQDSDLESTKARVLRLEQIAATNTEGRIRTECLSSIILSPLNGNVKMSPHERKDVRVESKGTATSECDFCLR